MGNTSCCCSCSPFQPENQSVMNSMPVVEEMSHIDELVSYIDQLLNPPAEGQAAKPDRVDSSIKSGGDLLEKVLKLCNRHSCQKEFMPKLDRETRRLAIDITKQGVHIKWLGVALSVVGFVLEQFEQVSSNINECKDLLKYMCNLAKYIKQLDQQLFQEKLNEVLQFILKGSLMCISQMKRDRMSRFFVASVDAEDLRSYQSKLGREYSELTLEALITVLQRIPVVLPSSQGKYPEAVGFEEARDTVIQLLNMQDTSKKVVVIYGQGGIGKTTLATAVINHLDLNNYNFCRIDIEQDCVERDLKLLQQKILRDLFDKNLGLSSWVEGQQQLSEAFENAPRCPVFMFLDNALKSSDLEKLLPIKDLPLLPEQSRILLTTRNLNETRMIRQANIELLSHQVDSLPRAEAEKLLCEYALGSGQSTFHPTIDVDGLLRICSGIPLVLRLAGSRLREHAQSVPACKEAVEYIKEELLQGGDAELGERMVDFVYNRLQQSSKEAFQDIAFFFAKNNWDAERNRERVANALGEMELLELERAALVNVTEAGRLNVHDIVKARGRMLSDGYRITDEQSLSDVLQDPQKIQNTKGIDLSHISECKLEAEHLNLMSRSLRVLILRNLNIVNGDCKGIFENLRLLCLDYNIYSRMDTCKFPRLRVFFGFFNEGDRFCEFSGDVSSLKELYLNRATLMNLTTTLSQIKSLRSLALVRCGGFTSIPETIGNLSALTKLNLEDCYSLVSLPDSFGNLSALTELYLNECSSLVSLPNSFGNLSVLTKLYLKECSSLVSLPNSFGNLSALTELYLNECSSLVSLPNSVGNLSALTELYFKKCSSLVSLPNSFGNLSALTVLNLNKCSSLVSLSNSFGNLSALTKLYLKKCSSLGSLPNSFGNLSALTELYLNECSSLVSLPDSFGNLSAFTELDFNKCSSLVSLPNSFGNLSALTELFLNECSSLVSLPNSFGNLSALTKLYLYECSSLVSLPNSFGNLSALTELYLNYCSSLVSLPNSFGNLSALTKLYLKECSSLVSLPNSFGNLSALTELDFNECSSLVSLPNSFGNLSALTELYLNKCSSLVSLPNSFVNLSALTELYLNECSSFVSLPNSFGNLSALTELYLNECSSLVSLPDSFGNLLGLKSLQLRYCSNLVGLPDSIGQLSSLCDLDLCSCTQLSVLPKSFENLFSLNMLILERCEKVPYLPQNFGKLKSLKFLSINGCKGLHSLSSDFRCLSSLIAIKASECSQLEEKAMDILAEMKNLMFVDIHGSPRLIERWKQVKEQYSLAVISSETQLVFRRMNPYGDILCRAFFNSASKLLQLDGGDKFRESSSSSSFSANGERLGLVFTLCNLTSPENSRSLDTVKKKCVELGSQGFHIIYVEMRGSWEETETLVRQTLPHLPRGTHAWIAPDNRARNYLPILCTNAREDFWVMFILLLPAHQRVWIKREEED